MEDAVIPATKERLMNTGVMAEGGTEEKVGEEEVGRPRDEGNGRRR